MKREPNHSIYINFLREQIEKTETEDNIFIFAKKMVKAKDENGIDMFWDKYEEDFMRKYVEYTEDMAEC